MRENNEFPKTIALSIPVILAGAAAQSAVVNFDGLTEGAIMNGGFDFGDGLTGTISTSDLGFWATGRVLVCDTADGSECTRNDSDLESDFTAAASSDEDHGAIHFGNALILEEKSMSIGPRVDDAADGGMITFTFDKAVNLMRLAILDGNDNPATGGSIYLDGVLFDTNRGGGDNEYDIVKFDSVWVTSFSVDFAGSGAIGAFEASVSTVPVPASAILLLGGVGALGSMRRRKKS